MHVMWARSEQTRSCKESHEIFPKELPQRPDRTFVASYEKEQTSIGLLLGWEYGRLWLKEHKENMKKNETNSQRLIIDADFSWWVNKRAAIIDRRQIFMKKRQNPHVKNCNLTAFANSKMFRKNTKSEFSLNAKSFSQPGSVLAGSGLTTSGMTSLARYSPALTGSTMTGTALAGSTQAGTALFSSASDDSVPAGLASAASAPVASASAGAIPLTYAEKAKICSCKDCKQRRLGGREKKFNQLTETGNSIVVPWY